MCGPAGAGRGGAVGRRRRGGRRPEAGRSAAGGGAVGSRGGRRPGRSAARAVDGRRPEAGRSSRGSVVPAAALERTGPAPAPRTRTPHPASRTPHPAPRTPHPAPRTRDGLPHSSHRQGLPPRWIRQSSREIGCELPYPSRRQGAQCCLACLDQGRDLRVCARGGRCGGLAAARPGRGAARAWAGSAGGRRSDPVPGPAIS